MNRHAFLLRGVLCAGAMVRLVIAWLPLEWQLNHVLCDDSFYYFTIARTLAHSGIVSFDGIAPTNGFHPLWLALITPIYSFGASTYTAIPIILTLCGIADMFALLLFVRILRRLSIGPPIVLLCTGLYACAPALLTYAGAINGLETALNTLVLMILLTSFLAVMRRQGVWYASPIAFGTWSGLALLARTDNIVIIVVLFVSVLVVTRPWKHSHMVHAAVTTLLVATPWVFWNVLTFGTVLQVSGEAYAFSVSDLQGVASWGAGEYAYRIVRNLTDVIRFFPLRLTTDTKYSVEFALQAAGLCVCTLYALTAFTRSNTTAAILLRKRIVLLSAPLLSVVLFVTAHSLKSITLRGWYYATVLPILSVVFAVCLDYCASAMQTRLRRILQILSGVLLLALALSTVKHTLERHQGELDKYAAVSVMKEVIPPGEPIGAWNAGVYGYFYEGGPVVNLDGLVNNEVLPHLKHRTLGTYCRERAIHYLVDAQGAFTLWDPYWAAAPGELRQMMTVLRSLGTQDSAMAITLVRTTN